MIFLDIVGRCGNQMFQYAFAKKISVLNNDEEISIDFYHVYKEAVARNDGTFKNELEGFRASEGIRIINEGENKIYKYGSKKQKIIFKIYTKIKRLLQKVCDDKRIANKMLYKIMAYYGIYWYYAPEKLKACKEENKFIWGYFENPNYFDDISVQIHKAFVPKEELETNLEIHNVIRASSSVCVSFRKWNDNEPVGDERFVCNKRYYQDALKLIFEKIPEASLIVFSNDVEWVKKEFELPENTIYETGEDSICEKMRLMSSCKHFILSNSTFAWWAQYLGRDEGKVVISPECWFRNEKKKNPLLQDNFVKVRIE